MRPFRAYQQIFPGGDLHLPERETFFENYQAWDSNPWIPPANIREANRGYLIGLAVPGAKKNEIILEIEKSRMIITSKSKGRFRKEYKSRNFLRSFCFPDNANRNTIVIKYENDILKTNIAKEKKEKRKPVFYQPKG